MVDQDLIQRVAKRAAYRAVDTLLAAGLYPSEPAIDRDGADIKCFGTPETLEDAKASRHVAPVAHIQVKFRQTGTSAAVREDYVRDSRGPRPDFFTFVYSGDPTSETWDMYFFSARDMEKVWSAGSENGVRVLRWKPASADSTPGAGTSASTISTVIRDGAAECRRRAAADAVAAHSTACASWRGTEPGEYSLRIVDGARVVTFASGGSMPEVLQPARNRYTYSGGYAWGYRGSGPQCLSWSLLSHFLGPEREPSQADFDCFLDYLASLDGDTGHVISTESLRHLLPDID